MTGFPQEHKDPDARRDEWYTPPEVFGWMGKPAFTMDVCSPGPLLVPWIPAARHLTAVEDGLRTEWAGMVWCNPPYSNVAEWVTRFTGHGNGVVLTNSRTDTAWFHRLVHDPCAVFFPAGRIRFLAGDGKRLGFPPVGQVFVGLGAGQAVVERMGERRGGTVLTVR